MLKVPAPTVGFATERVSTTNETPGHSERGDFRTVCDFSHMLADDPLVYPGRPGASHLHAFFGNTGTNAGSTPESIASAGNSTCRGGLVNRSAYWVPAMIDTRDGAPLRPLSSNIYYKTGYRLEPHEINVPPVGLRMIAGNASSAAPQQAAYYICHNTGDGDDRRSRSIPDCPAGSELWQVIAFPQCWNGNDLDSSDHKGHMAYAGRDGCPASHPVGIPEITFNIVYKVNENHATPHWRLASDNYSPELPGGLSSHGDWIHGWKQDIIETFVHRCDRARVDCHSHLLGDGRAIY